MSGPVPPALHGLVLAGGRSRRLGTDKAALQVDGQSLLARTVDLLSTVVDEVFVSAHPAQRDDPLRHTWRVLHDRHAGLGPAAGLLAAWVHDPAAAWLVLACDMPGLDRATLDRLCRARDVSRAATALRNPADGLPEPLCAIWEPATLARLAAELAAGRVPGPRALLRALDTHLLDAPSRAATNSINTPADLAALRAGGARGRKQD